MSDVLIKCIREDGKELIIGGEDWGIITKKGLTNWGSVNNDISTMNNLVNDGVYVTATRVGKVDRSFRAMARNASNNEALRLQANTFFNVKKLYNVYLTYMGVTRWAEAYLYKYDCSTSNIYEPITLDVTFLFANPYLKSVEDFGKNLAGVVPMASFPYICTVDYGRPTGRYLFSDVVYLENNGDVDTFCKVNLEAKGDVSNPKITIGNEDNYVRIIDEMVAGDVITIDFVSSPPLVKKNGVNIIGKADRTSNFTDMKLEVGDTPLTFSADTGDSNIDVYVYYNQLYDKM